MATKKISELDSVASLDADDDIAIRRAATTKRIKVAAFIRGSIDASRRGAMTLGSVDAAQRLANGTALQETLDYCAANSKWPEFPPGRYEYNASAVQNSINVGLRAPKESLGMIGGGMHEATGARLIQFAANHPVLTIGDVSADGNANMSGGIFYGFALGYGVSQVGQTQALALLLSGLKDCRIGDMKVWPWISGLGTFHPHIGLQIAIPASNRYFYDNEVENIKVCGGQASFCKIDANGTGNRWGTMHLGTGVFGDLISLTGPAMDVNTSNLPFGSIDQLNIEWATTPSALLQNRATEFNVGHLHFEGNKLVGTNESMIHIVNAGMRIGSIQARNNTMKAADISGQAAIFTHFGLCDVDVGKLYLYYSGAGYNADAVMEKTLRVFSPETTVGRFSSFRVRDIRTFGLATPGRLDLDANIAGATAATAGELLEVQEFIHGKLRSRTRGATIRMVDANLTVYGEHRHSKVSVTAALTVPRTLTLSNLMRAGSTVVRAPGDVVTVHRSGAGAGTLTVLNHSGGTINTVASGAEAGYEWTGTAWIAI